MTSEGHSDEVVFHSITHVVTTWCYITWWCTLCFVSTKNEGVWMGVFVCGCVCLCGWMDGCVCEGGGWMGGVCVRVCIVDTRLSNSVKYIDDKYKDESVVFFSE